MNITSTDTTIMVIIVVIIIVTVVMVTSQATATLCGSVFSAKGCGCCARPKLCSRVSKASATSEVGQ